MKDNSNISQAPFRFLNFVIAESKIKIEPKTKAESIDVKIEPKGVIYEENKNFEIYLYIYVKSNDGLDVYVKMNGLFEFKEVTKLENLSNYFYINAPAIIFPYLRSYVSALTALSGCRTILLPPLNLTSLGKDLKQNTITK